MAYRHANYQQVVDDFISDPIILELLDQRKYEDLYLQATRTLIGYTGILTDMLHEAEIYPELELFIIPRYFLYDSSITLFDIPNHITAIWEDAFADCEHLIKVTIPDTVNKILENAFMSCPALSEVKMSINVKEIGDYAFNSCSSLTQIDLGEHLEKLGDGAFTFCTQLKYIKFPASLTALGKDVFYGCKDLTIDYAGTKAQWNELAKGKFNFVTYICNCTDGVVRKLR